VLLTNLSVGLGGFRHPIRAFRGLAVEVLLARLGLGFGGVAIMFCLLPPTRLALGGLSPDRVPDASGLFNLMRNLGGAIGIALIDTVIYGRAPVLGQAIVRRLERRDVDTALAVGVPLDALLSRPPGPTEPAIALDLKPMVENLALVQAINEAWLLIAAHCRSDNQNSPAMIQPPFRRLNHNKDILLKSLIGF
jgi:hypothetical protein